MEIRLSISKKSYKVKPTRKEISMMVFEPSTISLSLFAELIRNGYNYCHIYNTSTSSFNTWEKTNENFNSTNIIILDIDDTNKPFEEYIGNLTYIPTISYTTPSNDDSKQIYKYRVVYVFEQSITSETQFHQIYDVLSHQAEVDNQGTKCDSHLRAVAQYANGSYGCRMINDFSKTYNISDFTNCLNTTNNVLNNSINIICDETKKQDKKKYKTKINKSILNDYYSLEPLKFLYKYKSQYPIIENNDEILEYIDGVAEIKDGYIELYRKFRFDTIESSNGLSKLITRTTKIKDGQGRRSILYKNGLIKKAIKPSITIEEMIYNLVYERQYYIDNTDNVVNNETLLDIAVNAFNSEVKIRTYNKRKHKVNKEWCVANGLTPKQYYQMWKKEQNYRLIDSWYDISISLKENLKMALDSDIKISRATLFRYTKDRGINTNPDKGNNKNHKPIDEPIKESNLNTDYVEPIEDDRRLDLVNELNDLYNQQSNNNNTTESNETNNMKQGLFLENVDILINKLNNFNNQKELYTKYNDAINWVNKIISKYQLNIDVNAINKRIYDAYNNRLNQLNKTINQPNVISVSHLNSNDLYNLIQRIQKQNESDLIINNFLVKKTDDDYPFELIAHRNKEYVISVA